MWLSFTHTSFIHRDSRLITLCESNNHKVVKPNGLSYKSQSPNIFTSKYNALQNSVIKNHNAASLSTNMMWLSILPYDGTENWFLSETLQIISYNTDFPCLCKPMMTIKSVPLYLSLCFSESWLCVLNVVLLYCKRCTRTPCHPNSNIWRGITNKIWI